jgi:HD-like signal output (HDOD) protein
MNAVRKPRTRPSSPLEAAVSQIELRVAAPTTIQRVLAILDDADSSWRDVERAMSVDVALVTRTLRLASTMEFAARPVSDVRSALQYLGINQLRRLVIAAHFSGSGSPFARASWTYALRVAITCESISRVAGLARDPDPFLCGLLHDVGTAIMDQLYEAEYRELGFEPGSDEQPVHERAQFGFDHCDVGAIAASRWNLFPELELVAQLHHDPSHARILGLPKRTVQAIELVALGRIVGRGQPDEAVVAERDRLSENLGIAPEIAEACAEASVQRAGALMDAMK